MTANCTVQIPADACAEFPNRRAAVRTLLDEALGAGLVPWTDPPRAGSVQVSVYLPTDLATRSRQVAAAHQLGFEEAIAGLIHARMRQRAAETPGAPPQSAGRTGDPATGTTNPFPTEARPDARAALQARLHDPLMAGLRDGKIVFAEGGTGLGKSRVIARCALDHLRETPQAKVLVLAPTISVLVHLVREFRQVAPSGFEALSVVLGRSQFVSSRRLESLLSLPCPEASLTAAWRAAADWSRNSGRSSAPPSGGFAREFSLSWLADDLRRAAPRFPVDDVLLGAGDGEDTGDPAHAAYQSLRLRAFDEEIRLVFATHAMACLNVWSLLRPDRQRGILPSFSLMLIDEAHELEEVMARTIGSSVSLLHMRQVLRQGVEQSTWQKFALTAAAHEALGHLDRAERALHQMPGSGLVSTWNGSSAEQSVANRAFDKFLKVACDLDASLRVFADLQDEAAGELPFKLLREWHHALRQLLDGKQNVWVDFSPVLRTPRLTIGPSQLIRPFEELWGSCRAAGLLSGTLYLPNADGRLSSGFLRMKLLVPRERALEIEPVHPAWNFSTPTVYLPSATAAEALTYPGTAEDEGGTAEVRRWHETVARRLRDICATAMGGTLVLCCSYLDIRALSELLVDDLGERLLASRGESSVRSLAEEFVGLGRKEARPVWLVTGSAWTGLDLADPQAADPLQDFLLTDLVITRIPFGTNKTAVHRARIKRLGFDVEAMEAALRLKQGIGRLIRREGVTNRRLWMLDGRSQGRRAGYFKRVFGPLGCYPKRDLFS